MAEINQLKYDGAIVLDCTNVNLPIRYRLEMIRPLGPFAVFDVLQSRNIKSTVINYADFWKPDVLINTLDSWCNINNITSPLILTSSLFGRNMLAQSESISAAAKHFKKNYNATIIMGGGTHVKEYKHISLKPDYVFHGRSLHLFEKLLDGIDSPHTEDSGIQIYRSLTGDMVEQPTVPNLYDDYCLNENDVVQFQSRLGCKFDCDFCAEEFRASKNPPDADEERLYNFFMTAYEKYGITRFNCVDDTFNEEDAKVERMLRVVERLPFKPTMCAYIRFDVLMAKPYQLELLDKIGIHGQFYGIETFHYEASKGIHKTMRRDRAFEFLHRIKQEYPHWYKTMGCIIGLPHEPAEHATETVKYLVDNELFESINPGALFISSSEYGASRDDPTVAHFTKRPEDYGITVRRPPGWDVSAMDWEHEHMTYTIANALAKKLGRYIVHSGKCRAFDPWEWIQETSVGDIPGADIHIHNYINAKINFLTRP